MKARLAVAITLACVAAGPVSAQEPPSVEVVTGLDFPTGIAFAPDGRMFVNERAGRIRVVSDGGLDPTPVARIPTTTSGEAGLLGIALPPDFSSEERIYAFATAPDGVTNQVWRVPLSGGEPEVIVPDLPASGYHNGGGLAFDEAGFLFVSNGEQHSDGKAQDPDVLGGKVYRFTADGAIPRDNPFGASPAYAIGLRNPYGLAIDPVSGDPFVTENGPSSFDEVNRIEAGGNYGWPEVSGPASGDVAGLAGTYHDPILAYEEIIVPTGITFADGPSVPREVRGDVFFGSFGEQALHRVRLGQDRARAESEEVIEVDEPVVAVAWGPDGLYYSTFSSIRLMSFGGQGSPSEEPEVAQPAPSGAPPEADEGAGVGLTLALLIGVVAAVGALAFSLLRSRTDR